MRRPAACVLAVQLEALGRRVLSAVRAALLLVALLAVGTAGAIASMPAPAPPPATMTFVPEVGEEGCWRVAVPAPALVGCWIVMPSGSDK